MDAETPPLASVADAASFDRMFGEEGIASSRLGTAVIERLTRAIVDGRLKPGDPLPSEGQIAATFGISKPIAREALRELAAMGVIQVQQGKVSRVRAIDCEPLARFFRFAVGRTEQGLHDAVELRRMLEPRIAHLAAERRTSERSRRAPRHPRADGDRGRATCRAGSRRTSPSTPRSPA